MSRDHSRRHNVANVNERANPISFAVGAKVQVRVKDPSNGPRWVDGLVKVTAQGGAFVQVGTGAEGFFYFRDIQGIPKRKPKPAPDPTERVPGWKSSPPGGVSPLSVQSVGLAEAAIAQEATPMGAIGWTDQEAIQQPTLAPSSSDAEESTAWGSESPANGNTIEDILARANKQSKAEGITMTEEKATPIPRIGLAESSQSESESEEMSFEEFLEHLCELVIIPADRETRKRWLSLARELHAMTLS